VPKTVEEIKAAGALIDVPWAGLSADPQPLRYGQGARDLDTRPGLGRTVGYAQWLREQEGADKQPGEEKE
jgi:hypothetical protein